MLLKNAIEKVDLPNKMVDLSIVFVENGGFNGKTMGKWWFLWENHVKMEVLMGKPWENHGKSMGNPWENGDFMVINGD